jgi:gamma-glutamylcyclotransferase (GGCT)/AIG2-like uncharacterized protein YtfP
MEAPRNDRLFVYGTLHPDRAPSEIAGVVARMTPVGRGTIRGMRYELGSFPAVVFDHRRAGLVEGEVFLLPEDPEALPRLDRYEDYDPENLPSSLFRRERTTVTFNDGSQESCWVYLYNQPLPRNQKSAREAVLS